MAVRRFTFCLIGTTLLLAGCETARQVRDPEYAHVENLVYQASYAPTPGVAPVHPDLVGPLPVGNYIQYALTQNPSVQAARKRMEAVAHQVAVAASLQDPILGTTFFPKPVQTASGEQQFALSASQQLPYFGKLSTRADAVEARTDAARAELAAAELKTIERVKRAYYELYFIEQAIIVTEAEQDLLTQIRDSAIARYEANLTSQQDVLRADLEISNIESELIRLRQRFESGQARLAAVLHISTHTKVRAVEKLPDEQLPGDLEWLQRQAIAARPELHAKLAALDSDQQAVELARLDYMPDLTLGATWIDVASSGISPIANGRDSFLIGAGINLPIYRKRLDSSLRSAEAQAVSTAREYDSLRDITLEQVMDLFAQAQSQQDLLTLYREDILPTARQTLEVSNRAYDVGEVDFLQLIDNWRELLRYEVSFLRLEASLRQTLAQLEAVVGGFAEEPASEIVPAPPGAVVPAPPEEAELAPPEEAVPALPEEAVPALPEEGAIPALPEEGAVPALPEATEPLPPQ